ncbi:hypothetical protein ACFSSC_03340 [Corynebacterium mendelii]|uniref:Uncharacterized protein n=1 Tax=Corynebacterium mendelii TaxID=2765362 RepID=A0A939E151_9CORY|nr:hypothetical protein [Corynebacterium mendelii]MBN9643562.1 hypothetical protein [Corynebacterium mendelii]
MARHTNGQFTFKVAAGPIVIALVVTLVACMVWLWTVQRDAATRAHDTVDPCKGRQVMLTVAGTLTPELAELLTAFDKTRPIVDGYCVRTMTTADVNRASVIIAPGSRDLVADRIIDLKLAPSGDTWPVAYTRDVGVAHLPMLRISGDSWTDLAGHGVALPALPVAEERAVAALRLAGGDSAAAVRWIKDNNELTLARATTLKRPLVAMAEKEVPEGYRFTRPEPAAILPFYVVPLTQSPTVNARQQQAGMAFVSFIAEHVDQSLDHGIDTGLLADAAAVTAATTATGQPQPPDNAPAQPAPPPAESAVTP